jgi:hypothetical protein
MTDTDQKIKGGVDHAYRMCAQAERLHGRPAAMAYAAGLATGARNYVAENFGVITAHDLMDGLAIDSITPILTTQPTARGNPNG